MYYRLPQRVIIVEMKNIEIVKQLAISNVFDAMCIFFVITSQMYYFYDNKKTYYLFLKNYYKKP